MFLQYLYFFWLFQGNILHNSSFIFVIFLSGVEIPTRSSLPVLNCKGSTGRWRAVYSSAYNKPAELLACPCYFPCKVLLPSALRQARGIFFGIFFKRLNAGWTAKTIYFAVVKHSLNCGIDGVFHYRADGVPRSGVCRERFRRFGHCWHFRLGSLRCRTFLMIHVHCRHF